MSVRIAVPATSANLGPGFDVLGLALSLHNVFEFDAQAEGLSITGCDPAYAGEDNLAVAAWRAVERRAGAKPSGIRLHIETNVPVARGLGSSATLLAAGALAANYFLGAPLGQDEILSILTELEGHPDNVAPALLGGLRGSMAVDGRVLCAEYPVHPGFGFCALIPNFETSTRDARRPRPSAEPDPPSRIFLHIPFPPRREFPPPKTRPAAAPASAARSPAPVCPEIRPWKPAYRQRTWAYTARRPAQCREKSPRRPSPSRRATACFDKTS